MIYNLPDNLQLVSWCAISNNSPKDSPVNYLIQLTITIHHPWTEGLHGFSSIYKTIM
jgi:hypothetical protein